MMGLGLGKFYGFHRGDEVTEVKSELMSMAWPPTIVFERVGTRRVMFRVG